MENKDSKKLSDLLQQLLASGYEVKEGKAGATADALKNQSKISKETLEKLRSNPQAYFEAWVAWSKSF